MENTLILARFTNAEDGMESVVTKGDRGFHATLFDLDSGESVATRIYPTRTAAEGYARRVVANSGVLGARMTPAELMKLSKQHAAILAKTRVELALNFDIPSRDIIAAACAEMGISEETWRALESFRIERGLPAYSITAR